MNKYEVSEIKKNFKEDSPFLTVNRVALAVVDGEGNVKYKYHKAGCILDSRESDMYYDIFKKVLNTKVGKNFLQYDFPHNEEQYNNAENLLYRLKESGMNDESIMSEYLDTFVDDYATSCPYAFITAHCTYNVRKKNMMNEEDEMQEEQYNFILSAVCPATLVDSGFSFNNATGEFSTESDTKLYINQKPIHGFMYPTFDNRSANASSVMYYCKKSSEPDVSIIDNFLECNFIYSADQEKDIFSMLIQQAFGDKANYQFVYALNDKLCDKASEYVKDTRLYRMGMDDFVYILEEMGASDDELKAFKHLYQQYVGDNGLTLNNIIESQIKIKTSEYTICLSRTVGDLVSTSVVDGARAIKLQTSDSKVEVNEIGAYL